MPVVCVRVFRMEIERSAQVRVKSQPCYIFQRANNLSQHIRSYYAAEIWGADASPNFWGFFSVDGPYTMVNILMMCAASL